MDDTMALLVVPTQEGEEHLVVRFDPATGKARYVEAMKYKHPADPAKTLWVNAMWLGDRPWASFDIEDVTLNAEVDTSLDARGARAQGETRACDGGGTPPRRNAGTEPGR